MNPPDNEGNSLAAWPLESEEDFLAYKKGLLRNLYCFNKKEHKKFKLELDTEIFVSDEVLKSYLNDIFLEKYNNSFYEILIRAKKKKGSIKAYYNFINTYNLYKNGDDSYSNVCYTSI